MKKKMIMLEILFALAIGFVTACSPGNRRLHAESPRPASLDGSPVVESHVKGNPPSESAIRKVDFKNHIYTKLPTGKCSMDEVRLKDGRYEAPTSVARKIPSTDCWSVVLGSVIYGDATGDGLEEAIVMLYAELGGTESAQDVYIYGMEGEQPRLLWKFATGDRAGGGRRRIAAENGILIVELFGKGSVLGRDLYDTGGVPDCCPKFYTRTEYRWEKDHFEQIGPEQILPNPSGNAIPVTEASPGRIPTKAAVSGIKN